MSEEGSNENLDAPQTAPDPAITREVFSQWRTPRFGNANPERMNNPVWEWLVKSKLSAYKATEQYNAPSAMDSGPGWCCDRFGQSSTQLADGRLVLIAGEHEDHYDPDFFIYNDVVVRHREGRIDIFGYAREVFPPTDFHSATAVGSRIVIIGNLGCLENRRPGTTPVFLLDLDTFTISSPQTSGPPPGWIHRHEAHLSGDGASILIQRGVLDRGDAGKSLVENLDEWRLHLANWRWERLTERRWQRWQVRREDGKANHLFAIQQARWERDYSALRNHNRLNEALELPSLDTDLGTTPDLELFERLYKPDLPHEELQRLEDEYRVHRIKVAGTIVRYVDDMYSIQMTVEGDLPQETIDFLASDLLRKMSVLENTRCELARL